MPNANLLRLAGLLGLIAVLPMGCVRRRMTIRTNPAGANVYIDKQLIGTSPASTSYRYYGYREVEVVRDGYRTEKVLRKFSPPWYQLPPLDFVTEVLWPWEIRDERIVDITMVPYQAPTDEELQRRADGLRVQASQGIATTLPPTATTGPDFREQTILPSNQVPVQPLDPNYVPPAPQAIVTEQPLDPNVDFPNDSARPGSPFSLSIPEVGILRGGGKRPEVPEPAGN